ncbi:mitochondrial import inner membrane translocase subunit TIM44 isoform X1 [Drosophila grimshawi]|uniref:Mitochondrial import inner membrane translocase subunit TIM44 n=1 Tax=Drosophila grimshawi TaxID=7222 RepID=B4JII9_DROGR|nr:mitochondrial import inner membrane translocase subunit TIM44 isoform X1 [Drosophila grimshawi]EDV93070.1 GH18477 [Drosophila grimshawi]
MLALIKKPVCRPFNRSLRFNKYYEIYKLAALTRERACFITYQLASSNLQQQPQRWYGTPGRRPGFFSQFVENVRSEMDKNKEMKDSIKKFREEAQKLEQSDALKSARQKFNIVESEAQKSSSILKEQLGAIKEKVGDVIDDASKSDLAKKVSEELSKKAKGVSDTITDTSDKIGQSGAFKAISDTTTMIKKEMNATSIDNRVYCSPVKLRKRVQVDLADSTRVVEANTEATGLELHKDSKFYQSWENFKNNNTYVNKVFDWKVKYDESENPVIRASRLLTDKVSDVMGGLFSKTELSETMTELVKIDPNFDQKEFLHDCEKDIIPNVLEAIVRGDLEILKDWCFESTYNIIATPITQAKKSGLYLDSKILDIENIELAMGKVMEQGPVLIITFQAQQIMCVRDQKAQVVEGDPDKVMRVHYVWVLCRDRNELNPKAAWRLMELSANSQEQFV